jgi:hypothetical protein
LETISGTIPSPKQRIHKLISFVAGIIHPGRKSPLQEAAAGFFGNVTLLWAQGESGAESGCLPLAEVEILHVLENRLAGENTCGHSGI